MANARAAKKSPTVRTAAKRAPAKRAPAKKTAAKKTATKKPAAKKTSTKSAAKKSVAKSAAKKSTSGVSTRLAKYRSMRDFEKTPEPSGATPAARADALSFVVQKHAASHLHYDFRLELDGVLLSWSVPKGPSLRPGERRLAVRTEDHPLEYASFEGIIPKGEYGGGTVIVWDHGTWAAEGDARKAVEKGKLTFTLAGQKLTGRFHLARTRPTEKQEHWLLFKGNDAGADAGSDIVAERPESAVTGRTIEEVAAAPDRVWHSNREPSDEKPKPRAAAKKTTAGPQVKAAVTTSGDGRADVLALVKRLPLRVALTNLEKVLYPEQNVRKAELIAYYAAVASHALPYLGGRPLMLVRCPHGRAAKCFYQKHANDGVPDVVRRVGVHEGGQIEQCMTVDDMDGLVALAQLGALEVHTWMCQIDRVEEPDQFVFDIDPDEKLGFDVVVETALLFKQRLEELGLQSFVKTTGGKGLHVVTKVVPGLDWDEHKAFAKAVADSIARERPNRYLTNMRKDLRKGRLFLDYLRNGRGATAIAPYSTRAREGATVATPIGWDELERGVKPKDFTLYSVTERLAALKRDPWAELNTLKQCIPPASLRKLGVRK